MDWSSHSQAGLSGSPIERAGTRDPREIPLELRRLDSVDEFTRAVALQRLTWGESFRDVVPAAILKVTQRVGGVTAGAFGPDGEMLGFVYGLTGFCDGKLAHWSHMLAVRPEYRDRGIGRRLKEYQRELLLAARIEWMYWTVDPLVARNAHLNVNRLHASVREYVPEMYGDTGSGLHAFGTDRFVMAWPLGNGQESVRAVSELPSASTVVLNELDERGLATVLAALSRPQQVQIEIPPDIEMIGVGEARAWRAATRRAFLSALRAGYEVQGFRGAPDGRCFYALALPRATTPG
ncbi:MAG: GNAT family N-acetyltransferase [Longimicrobiales bacterium]